jgi:hypothetical protein
MFRPVIAHIAGVPVEEVLFPLVSGGGVLGLALRWLRIRMDRNSRCARGELRPGLADHSGGGASEELGTARQRLRLR